MVCLSGETLFFLTGIPSTRTGTATGTNSGKRVGSPEGLDPIKGRKTRSKRRNRPIGRVSAMPVSEARWGKLLEMVVVS